MSEVKVTTWHLEIEDAAALRPASRAVAGLSLTQARHPSPELNRYLYTAVGGDWFWTDRLGWGWDQWMTWLTRPGVETWVAALDGTPVGYVELALEDEKTFKIEYLGVIHRFAGQGIGAALLEFSIRRGFGLGARRVWVHTCSLDHPGALGAYEARGMRVFKVEEHSQALPAEAPGPWPGARRVSAEPEAP
jgi:GNAT superfamily N-acetyltransferase